MSYEVIMSVWQLYTLLLSAFVLGFSTGTLTLWIKLLWRMHREPGQFSKHVVF